MPSSLRIYTLAQYLAADFASSEALIPGLLYKEQNSFLVATQKAGKTLMTGQLALCLAAGVPFLQWSVPKPRKVVYFNFEGRDAAGQRRFRRMIKGMSMDRPQALENLVVVRTFELPLAIPSVLAQVDEVLAAQVPDLVIFDPLYRLIHRGTLTDDDVARELTGALAYLTERHHHATWIPHHEHRVKHDQFGSEYEAQEQRYFGSYVLGAWCDVMFGTTLKPKSKRGTFTSHFGREDETQIEQVDTILEDKPDELYFRVGAKGLILGALPSLAGKSIREAGRTMDISFETMREALQALAKEGRLMLYSQGQGKETIIGMPEADDNA